MDLHLSKGLVALPVDLANDEAAPSEVLDAARGVRMLHCCELGVLAVAGVVVTDVDVVRRAA